MSVANGEVSLGGPVPTLAKKLRAGRVVSSFKGARTLENGIVVNPARADADIAAAVTDAIESDPATRGLHLAATAIHGVVTIRGSAESPTQREVLSELASRVAGVQQVHLAVELSPATREESMISADVDNRLDEDSRLDGRRVVVAVHGRDVSLSGVVGSLLQHDAAVADAWVPGVASVTGSDLRVDWLSSAAARAIDRQSQPNDAHLADVVRSRLSSDARIGAPLPRVAIDGGVATLTGPVADLRAERASVRDAYRVRGVRQVVDRMSDTRTRAQNDTEGVPGAVEVEDVSPVQDDGHPVTPPTIEARTRENVFWDPRVGNRVIEVTVGPDGAVTLTGTVDTAAEMRAADADAVVAGAARVTDRLEIAKTADK